MRRKIFPVSCVVSMLCAISWVPAAHSYPFYDDGAGVGCVQCHPLFVNGPQRALHAAHQANFLVTECNACHPNGGGSTPVQTYWSGPGGGFGCAGCHGRDYGETSPNSGLPKATAYGLRQHHANNGITVCQTCHSAGQLGHPNPLPAILDESVPPPYYRTPITNLVNTCSSTEEDTGFDGDAVGLDNDGDGAADWPADTDCMMPTTTTTSTSTTTTTTLPSVACTPAPAAGCIAPGKAVLQVSEKKPGKEKVKVGLKKLVPAVTQLQFGDPIASMTSYAVCIYDQADGLVGQMQVNRPFADCGIPPVEPCWKALSDKGYKFLDKATTSDGVLKLITKGGKAGKGKVTLVGKNDSRKGLLSLPTGIAPLLAGNTQATVQIVTSDADCFGVTVVDVKKAESLFFKATGP